jgi:hypothetical protein
MGRLSDFLGYLANRIAVMQECEAHLCTLQRKYESFFSEVTRVRESELEQLTAHILADRGKLPASLDEALTRAERDVVRELDEKLERLRRDHKEALALAEEIRQKSRAEEQSTRKANVDLDAEEEKLKAQSAELLGRIDQHNARIRELGHGFGFFFHFFRMRAFAAERQQLEEQQANLAARIEQLRSRWANAAQEHTRAEGEWQASWVAQQAEASALQAKIEYLEGARPKLLLRSTIERVLFQFQRQPQQAGPGDPPCPRCKTPNPAASYFCAICAQRLQPDRPDLEGSIEEISEVNLHHQRFSEGMRAGQELIGLVRGLCSGLEAFSRSVQSVQANESRYPLPKLQLEVPESSVTFGQHFERLREAVGSDLSLHPKEFAEQTAATIRDVLNEQNIKRYFEAMGEELSRQAKAQWG